MSMEKLVTPFQIKPRHSLGLKVVSEAAQMLLDKERGTVIVFNQCQERKKYFSAFRDGSDYFSQAAVYRDENMKASDRSVYFDSGGLVALLLLNKSLVKNISIIKTRKGHPRGFRVRFLKKEGGDKPVLREKRIPFSECSYCPNATLQAAVDWKYQAIEKYDL